MKKSSNFEDRSAKGNSFILVETAVKIKELKDTLKRKQEV